MSGAFFVALMLSGVAGPSAAQAAEKRAIGRVAAGVQLGGFYGLADPGLELRGWAKGLGLSLSLGRHSADPGEPGFTEVFSDPGKQVTGGLLLAFVNRRTIRAYATGGMVHGTQARGRWERAPGPDGTIGIAAVEGQTGTWPFGGVGVEIGFKALPGLAVGAEFLLAFGGSEGGTGPGARFAVRYYPW
jgi:hypothetical protein